MRAICISKYLAIIVLAASPALADLHYFTQGSDLYHFDDNVGTLSGPVAIDASGDYPGLAFDPLGRLWAANNVDKKFYIVNPTNGDTTAVFDYGAAGSLGANETIISFDFRTVGSQLQVFGMVGGSVYTFDATTGAHLSTNGNGFMGQAGFPTTAYDPATETYWGGRTQGRALYELQIDSGNASIVGAMDGSPNPWDLAAGAWNNGQYWSGFRSDAATLTFGTIDTATGDYTEAFLFTTGDGVPATADGMGYAITAIPSPSATILAMAGFGLLGMLRRR